MKGSLGARFAAMLLATTLCRCPATAQDAPQFEVASIKPMDPDAPHKVGIHVYPGGRVEISGFALKTLIAAAFDLNIWQVAGGEEWTSKDQYVVTAKPPDSLRANIRSLRHTLFGIDDPLLRQMLQALLIERFQLASHRETKTGDVYVLQRGQKLAMKPAQAPEGAAGSDSFGSIGYVDGKWGLFATTMPQLAKFASGMILRAPVLDRTQLSGPFEYRQRQPDLEPRYGGDQTDSFLRFLGEAGLKCDRTKGPVETLTIDRASRPTRD